MKAPMTIKQYVSQMRKIPGGRFTMGRTYNLEDKFGTYKDEVPANLVDISAFTMGGTHVTVGMWREYLIANTSLSMPKRPKWGWIDSHPMVNVSWNDIMGQDGKGGYCAWASRESGIKLILPTEAQWEFVAKGGKDRMYPWGDEYDDSKLWGSAYKDRFRTAAVDRLNNVFTNRFGISDMCSNVSEWCLDGFQPYDKSTDRLGYVRVPRNPVQVGKYKCTRGASWGNTNEFLSFRCTARGGRGPEARSEIGGFRLVAPA
jgi:sulfatase modifying factor 1